MFIPIVKLSLSIIFPRAQSHVVHFWNNSLLTVGNICLHGVK